jgi:hypothetical protein
VEFPKAKIDYRISSIFKKKKKKIGIFSLFFHCGNREAISFVAIYIYICVSVALI